MKYIALVGSFLVSPFQMILVLNFLSHRPVSHIDPRLMKLWSLIYLGLKTFIQTIEMNIFTVFSLKTLFL